MSGRLPRYVFPDGTYHVCTRGVDGTPIYHDDHDRLFFLALLGDVVRRNDWLVHAFCLMTNHYHFVVESLLEELSAGLQRLTVSTPSDSTGGTYAPDTSSATASGQG